MNTAEVYIADNVDVTDVSTDVDANVGEPIPVVNRATRRNKQRHHPGFTQKSYSSEYTLINARGSVMQQRKAERRAKNKVAKMARRKNR